MPESKSSDQDAPSLDFEPSALRVAREKADFSQQDIANTLGLDHSTLHNWEHGKTTPREFQLQTLLLVYWIRQSRKDEFEQFLASHGLLEPLASLGIPLESA